MGSRVGLGFKKNDCGGGKGFWMGGEAGCPFYFLFVLVASTQGSKFLFLFFPFLV